jgi:prepilin-type N-terminal cleavage/methylation domain-containing protein
MKLDLQAKFLQHLSQKKQDEGFTLIELLVVIIIIGILSAIALPSFLNQANKAKQSEAKQYVGSMNRAEQAFYLEKNGFSSTIADLGLGIKTGTTNYLYKIEKGNVVSTSNPYFDTASANALAQATTLRSYLGHVITGQTDSSGSGEATTLAALCESTKPFNPVPTTNYKGTTGSDGGPACPDTTNWNFIK